MKEENSWPARPWTKPNFDAPTPPCHVGLDMCHFKMHHHMWKASKYVKSFSNEKFSKADEPKCKKNCLYFKTTWRNFSRPQRCCNFLSKKIWSLWCHFPMIDETNNSSLRRKNVLQIFDKTNLRRGQKKTRFANLCEKLISDLRKHLYFPQLR
jgi:hypothetical protein